MIKLLQLIKTIFICFLLILNLNCYAAASEYFEKGKTLFNEKKFDKSKILFERDLVFSVLLLNPQNDEAIYMLTLLKIKKSDYNEAKSLIEKFKIVCKNFCKKKDELEKKFEKIIPVDAKDNS